MSSAVLVLAAGLGQVDGRGLWRAGRSKNIFKHSKNICNIVRKNVCNTHKNISNDHLPHLLVISLISLVGVTEPELSPGPAASSRLTGLVWGGAMGWICSAGPAPAPDTDSEDTGGSDTVLRLTGT